MTNIVWQASIADARGDVQPTATVEVRIALTGVLATLYADRDGAVPLDNPFEVDSDGFARFYAAEGRYNIVATLSEFIARTFADVELTASRTRTVLTSQSVAPGTTQQDNLIVSPAGDVVRIEAATAGSSISGFDATGNEDRMLWIVNTGTGDLTLLNASASSTAGNRILGPTGYDTVIPPGGRGSIWYDTISTAWRII